MSMNLGPPAPPWLVYAMASYQLGLDRQPDGHSDPEPERPRQAGRVRRLTGGALVTLGRWLQGQPARRLDQPSLS